MIKCFISGPYTVPDPAENTRKAILVADELIDKGIIPFIPHLNHFWHFLSPRGYEEWLAYDLEWLLTCDCILRIPGESSGADKEVAFAIRHRIPVFITVKGVLSFGGV